MQTGLLIQDGQGDPASQRQDMSQKHSIRAAAVAVRLKFHVDILVPVAVAVRTGQLLFASTYHIDVDSGVMSG